MYVCVHMCNKRSYTVLHSANKPFWSMMVNHPVSLSYYPSSQAPHPGFDTSSTEKWEGLVHNLTWAWRNTQMAKKNTTKGSRVNFGAKICAVCTLSREYTRKVRKEREILLRVEMLWMCGGERVCARTSRFKYDTATWKHEIIIGTVSR